MDKDLKVTSGSRTHRSDQSPQFDQIKLSNPTIDDFQDFVQPEHSTKYNPFWSSYRAPYALIEDPESDEILSLGDSRCSSHWIQTKLEGPICSANFSDKNTYEAMNKMPFKLFSKTF